MLLANIFLSFASGSILLLCLLTSMKVTLYRFRNVMFVSGILFFFSAAVTLGATAVIELAGGRPVSELETPLWLIHEFTRRFVFAAIPILLILFLAMGISNLSLLRHEGVRVKNTLGSILFAAFLLCSGAILLLFRLFPDDTAGFGKVFHRLLFPAVCCSLGYFECVTAGIALMGWIASRQKPSYDKDFIIILGCSINKTGGLRPLLKGRVNRAVRYAWEQEIACGKPVRYVPSGGQGSDEIMSEASAMALYLEAHGAEQNEVFPEKCSTNTWENFCFSKKIILDTLPDANTAFSTTNYHVFRSGLLARKAGFTRIEAIASSTKWYFWPNGFAREIIGIFAMTWKVHAAAVTVILLLCLSNLLFF